MWKWVNQQRILSQILIIVSIGIIILSRPYAVKQIGAVNAAFFPTLIAGLLIGLSVILLIQSFRKGTPNPIPFFPHKDELKKLILYVGCISLYIFLLSQIGFIESSILFLFVMFTLLKTMSVVKRLIVSVLISSVIYFLFHNLLNVPLPTWL